MTEPAPSDEQARVGQFFDDSAQRYDDYFEASGPSGYALRARLETTLRHLGPDPGSVLDAGMGPGRLCAELDRRGWAVWGVDWSPEMVELGRRRMPHACDRLLRARIEELPFPDGSFDAVAATGVLEYADAPVALRELARVLRPGGRAVLSYPNPHALYGLWKGHVFYPLVRFAKRVLGQGPLELPHTASRIAPGEIESLLAAEGLVLRGSEPTSFLLLLSPFDELLPRLAERLGQHGAERWSRFSRRLATQVVYVAEKEAEVSSAQASLQARRVREQ